MLDIALKLPDALLTALRTLVPNDCTVEEQYTGDGPCYRIASPTGEAWEVYYAYGWQCVAV